MDLRGYKFDYTSPDGDWDSGEWGFSDYSLKNVLTPGDSVFRVEGHAPMQADQSERQMNAIENHLKFIEWTLAKKSGENVEPEWTSDDIAPYFKTSCKQV